MIRRALLVAAQISLVAVAGACTTPAEPEGPRIDSVEDLVAALREAGEEVAETGTAATAGSLAGGQELSVGGERVLAFEFESVAAREAATTAWMEDEAEGLSSTDAVLSVWARGRIFVVYRGFDGGLVALLSGLLGDPLTLPQGALIEPYPPAVAAAIGWLAESIDTDPGQVAVLEYTPADWPDSCLGLSGPGEACLQVITPGWRVVLQAGGVEYALRTDEFGTVIRAEP